MGEFWLNIPTRLRKDIRNWKIGQDQEKGEVKDTDHGTERIDRG